VHCATLGIEMKRLQRLYGNMPTGVLRDEAGVLRDEDR
jgi:hypothetical protein